MKTKIVDANQIVHVVDLDNFYLADVNGQAPRLQCYHNDRWIVITPALAARIDTYWERNESYEDMSWSK